MGAPHEPKGQTPVSRPHLCTCWAGLSRALGWSRNWSLQQPKILFQRLRLEGLGDFEHGANGKRPIVFLNGVMVCPFAAHLVQFVEPRDGAVVLPAKLVLEGRLVFDSNGSNVPKVNAPFRTHPTRNLLIPRVPLRIAQGISAFLIPEVAMFFEHGDPHVLAQDFNGVVEGRAQLFFLVVADVSHG